MDLAGGCPHWHPPEGGFHGDGQFSRGDGQHVLKSQGSEPVEGPQDVDGPLAEAALAIEIAGITGHA